MIWNASASGWFLWTLHVGDGVVVGNGWLDLSSQSHIGRELAESLHWIRTWLMQVACLPHYQSSSRLAAPNSNLAPSPSSGFFLLPHSISLSSPTWFTTHSSPSLPCDLESWIGRNLAARRQPHRTKCLPHHVLLVFEDEREPGIGTPPCL